MKKKTIEVVVNGKAHRTEVAARRMLSDYLRDDLFLTGTKRGCETGVCGACFAAAVAYRHRPEIHKRLMIAATVALLFAAVGRMGIESTPLAALVWLSPLLIGMVHDKVTLGRVHPVYVITTVALFIGATRVVFEESEVWLRIGRPLLDALL